MSSNEQPVFTTEWSTHRVRIPGAISISVHAAALMLAAFPWVHSLKAPEQTVTEVVLYTPSLLTLPRLPDTSRGGGGGGGMRAPTPPSLGRLPRGADKQLVPPTPEAKSVAPELIAEPTIVAPQLAFLPQISLLPLGDPDGVPGPPSAGPGTDGGIGTGNRHGVGPGGGPGAGPGKDGGVGGDSRGPGGKSASGGITMPVPLYTPDPNYSDDARKARLQGVVTLQTVVRVDGSVDVVGVLRSPGYGLDEEAVRTVKRWRFKPAMRNGQPVDVGLSIEVNFRIL